MKDIEASADFTSQLIKEKRAQAQLQDAADDSHEVSVKSEGGVKSEGEVKSEADKTTKLWYEAQSDEGHVYYWHIETGGKYEVVRIVDIYFMSLFFWELAPHHCVVFCAVHFETTKLCHTV